MSRITLDLLISSTGDSIGVLSQIASDSHRTFNNGGFMFKLGQNMSKRLLSGIFVAFVSRAVALMSSVTVWMRSLFSAGSWCKRALSALMKAREGGRIPAKDGMANVEREGGFRNACVDRLGPEGRPGREALPRPNSSST